MRLKYQGGGSLPGVPARDLTDEDLAKYDLQVDRLVASGLYKRVRTKKQEEKLNDGSSG